MGACPSRGLTIWLNGNRVDWRCCRTVPSDVYQGKVLAQLVYNQGGRNAVLVSGAQEAYSQGLYLQFVSEFTRCESGGCALLLLVVCGALCSPPGQPGRPGQAVGLRPRLVLQPALAPACQ